MKNFSLEEYPEEINLPDHEMKIAEKNEDLQKFKNQTSRSSKTELQEVQKSDFKKFENQTSRSSKIEIQEVQKSKCNYTEYSKTENNIDSYLSYPSQREDRMDLMEQ